jgi:glycosyltransferase involved in cell wall biosynthesis
MVKITIIIKALNEASNISCAIESSLRAIGPYDGEVILADSGSTDRTVEIAMQFPITIVQLSHFYERSCGVSAQLGYQHSRGEYVYILDGDMRLSATFLERAMELFDREPRVAGVGGFIREMRIANLEFENRARRLQRGRLTHPIDVDYLNGGGLYRRAAVEEVGYLSDKNLHSNEEYDLGVRLREKKWRIIRLGSHAADHYGYTMNSSRLLLHRAKTSYILGPGEVVRAAIEGGYLKNVLLEVRALRAYGFTAALWVLALLIPIFAPSGFWVVASWFALCALPVGAMILRHRSIKLGLYSVAVWQVQGLGLFRGLVRARQSPIDPIKSRVVQIGLDGQPLKNWIKDRKPGLDRSCAVTAERDEAASELGQDHPTAAVLGVAQPAKRSTPGGSA